MTDIVERLREAYLKAPAHVAILCDLVVCHEAADEIERLRIAHEIVHGVMKSEGHSIEEWHKRERELLDEIERLRAGNDDLVKTIEVLQDRYMHRRNEALEEAVRLADEWECLEAADAIRALKEQK